MKRWLFLAGKIALAVGLIAFLVTRPEFELGQLGNVIYHWHWLLLAQVPFALVLLLAAWRWKILLGAQDMHYRVRDVLALNLTGFFFNQVLLGTTGGDLVKAYYVAGDQPGRRAAAILTIFVDRALGLVVLMLIAAVAVFVNLELVRDSDRLTTGAVFVAVLLGTVLVGASLFYSESLRKHRWVQGVFSRLPFQGFLKQLDDAVYVYKFHKREVLVAGALSVLLHLGVVVTNIFLFKSLGEVLPPMTCFVLLVPLAQTVMAVPLTPASLGTGEAGYEWFFATVTKQGLGFKLSLMQRVTYYLWASFGCVIYLRRKAQFRRALEAEAAEQGMADENPPEHCTATIGGGG